MPQNQTMTIWRLHMPGQLCRFFQFFVCIAFCILKYQASFCFQAGFFASKSGKLTLWYMFCLIHSFALNFNISKSKSCSWYSLKHYLSYLEIYTLKKSVLQKTLNSKKNLDFDNFFSKFWKILEFIFFWKTHEF